MAQITMECPHCRAEKVGFAPRGYAARAPDHPGTLIFLQCENCRDGVILLVPSEAHGVVNWMANNGHFPGPTLECYPETEALEAPAATPPNVCGAFLSGLDNLGRKGGTNAAAIMFRRAVELAAKYLDPAKKSGDLKERINALSSDLVTPAMKKWAHHIRLDANDAAHEPEEFSDEDANALHTFAEMFLTYAFTLPAMLEKAGGKQK